jgi:hypothetical protein
MLFESCQRDTPKVPVGKAARMPSASNKQSKNSKYLLNAACAQASACGQTGRKLVCIEASWPLRQLVAVLTLTANAFAQQLGTADEAKAMLLKAVAALKADRDVTRGMINKGEGGFRDRDLYVFCVRTSDGKQLASGAVIPPIGTDQ